ncbi:hypothetical protein ES708_19167 [subsurface metagenome]
MNIPYSAGSFHRQAALEVLRDGIQKLNPKFKIELSSLPWPSYLSAMKEKTVPIGLFGLIPLDPNPYFTLSANMYSKDQYATDCGYKELAKEKYDSLIEELGRVDDKEQSREISYKLQRYGYEDCLNIFHFQAAGHIAMSEKVKGFSPLLTPMNIDFYPIYKE